VKIRLAAHNFYTRGAVVDNQLTLDLTEDRYRDAISRVRLGQGAFRVMVAEAYGRACAITGDHTFPALEAAHIRSFAEEGPNLVSNGLLLRSDLHKLFDAGYVTVTDDYRFEVSRAIREEYHNGREYYSLHGRKLLVIPESQNDQPSREFLLWHNEHISKAG